MHELFSLFLLFLCQLWDVTKERRVRVMRSHTERVGVLTWNSHTLTSGSQDSQVHNHDVRMQNHCIAQYLHHKLEVCGLCWSPDGTRLASGGNDNIACVWNPRASVIEPQSILTGHQAAVKVQHFIDQLLCDETQVVCTLSFRNLIIFMM